MERNSTQVIRSMIYLGEKLKNFPNQKNFPLGGSQFSQKDLEKEVNIWITDDRSLVYSPSWGPDSAPEYSAPENIPDSVALDAEKLQKLNWEKGVEIAKSHYGSNFINSNEVCKL